MADNIQISSKLIDESNQIYHVDIIGRVDAYTVGQLEEEIEKILSNTPHLIITLSRVDYVNSTGVGLLVKYHDRAESEGGELFLAEIPDKVEVVFNMLGLLDFFNVYRTVEDSAKAIKLKLGVATTGSAPTKQVARDISEIPANTKLFPLVVKCLICSKNLKFEIRGYYRCPSCSCHYIVTDDGKARGFKNIMSKYAELRLPSSTEFFDTAVVMTKSILDKTELAKNLVSNAITCVQKLFPLFSRETLSTIDITYVFNQTSISIGFLSTTELFSESDARAASILKEVQKITTSFEFSKTNQGAHFCRISIEN